LHDDEVAALAARLGGSVAHSLKSTVLSVEPSRVPDACLGVSSLPGLYHLSTITAVDGGASIAIHYHFWQGREFVEVRTEVPKDSPRLVSISGRMPSATLYEAEVQDLFGVSFDGNPYLGRRLLLPDDYPADAPPPLRSEADPEKIRKMMGLE
jgi:F420H2:quinone oxidoreductase subunit B/C